MDDRFLHEARRDPEPGFARDLRVKLRRLETAEAAGAAGAETGATPGAAEVAGAPAAWTDAPPARRRPGRGAAWIGFGAAAAAAAVLLFAFPSVRASGQAFLDLFRVRTFTAVSIDPARLEQLKSGAVDLKGLLSDRLETVRDPGAPQVVATPEEAGRLAGFAVRTPAFLPAGMAPDSICVRGEGEARLTVDAARLTALMRALDINDLEVPRALDGQIATVHTTPAVGIRYRHERQQVLLLQSRSPEIGLPAGIDLPRMGEIALRIAGLSATEARRFARSIDWTSTLLVPVSPNVSSFSQVTVRGNPGLLITTGGDGGAAGGDLTDPDDNPDGRAHRQRRGTTLLWSEGEMVYAAAGSLDRMELVQLAESLQ